MRISGGTLHMQDVSVDITSGKFKMNQGGAVTYEFVAIDYDERFERKRKALHDMVEEGDGFTREEVADLVETAYYAYSRQ